MAELKEFFQDADWKKEKHAPAIDAPALVKKGEFFDVTASVGKEIAHPNTTEHHIRWIAVYFIAEGEKFPLEIARFEFSAHGESAQGPNMSTIYTHPQGTVRMKTDKSGTILASSYCNIHGLWQSSATVKAG